MTSKDEHLLAEIERIKKGGAEKYHVRNREQKLPQGARALRIHCRVLRLQQSGLESLS